MRYELVVMQNVLIAKLCVIRFWGWLSVLSFQLILIKVIPNENL